VTRPLLDNHLKVHIETLYKTVHMTIDTS